MDKNFRYMPGLYGNFNRESYFLTMYDPANPEEEIGTVIKVRDARELIEHLQRFVDQGIEVIDFSRAYA